MSQQLWCCPPELSMPCDQYELHLENSVAGPNENQDLPVASLDQSTSTVTAVQLGHINVVLDHKSILLENYSNSFKKIYIYIYNNDFVFCILPWCFNLETELSGSFFQVRWRS